MPIEFDCPNCGHLVRTPDGTEGKKGQCPECHDIFAIPAANSVSTKPAKPGLRKAVPLPDTIKFYCAGCGGLVETPGTFAGKKGKCPTCGNVVAIPIGSMVLEASAGLTPIPGVGSLKDSGLVPLNPPQSNSTGLTPIHDHPAMPALVPYNTMAPQWQPATINPYQSPVASSFSVHGETYNVESVSPTATKICGILLAVHAGLFFVCSCGSSVLTMVLGTAFLSRLNSDEARQQLENGDQFATNGVSIMVIAAVIMLVTLVMWGITFFGAIQMSQFRRWGWALTACVLSIVPFVLSIVTLSFTSALVCIPGAGLGVWGLIVLNSIETKAAFR